MACLESCEISGLVSVLILAGCIFALLKIDFASRFPPRHSEASRLRGFEAWRLCDLQVFGKKVKLDFHDFVRLRSEFGTTFGI